MTWNVIVNRFTPYSFSLARVKTFVLTRSCRNLGAEHQRPKKRHSKTRSIGFFRVLPPKTCKKRSFLHDFPRSTVSDPLKGGPDPPREQKHPQSGKKCLRNTNFPLGLGVFDHSPGVLLKIDRFWRFFGNAENLPCFRKTSFWRKMREFLSFLPPKDHSILSDLLVKSHEFVTTALEISKLINKL